MDLATQGEAISVAFEGTVDDTVAAVRYVWRHANPPMTALFGGWVAVATMIGAGALVGWLSGPTWSFAPAVLILADLHLRQRPAALRRIRRGLGATPQSSRRVVYEASPAGFLAIGDARILEYPWGACRVIGGTREQVVILFGRRADVIVVPARAFRSPADFADWRGRIENLRTKFARHPLGPIPSPVIARADFQARPSELAPFSRWAAARQALTWWILIALAALAGLAIGGSFDRDRTSRHDAITVAAAAMAASLAAAILYTALETLRALMALRPHAGPRSVIAIDPGIFVEHPIRREFHLWEHVAVTRLKNAFALCFPDSGRVIVPRRAFSTSEGYERFLSLIESCVAAARTTTS